MIRQGIEVDCAICLCPISLGGDKGKGMLTIDHIIPKYLGGKDNPKNLQPTHLKCNMKRGHDIYYPRPIIIFAANVTLRELMSAVVRRTFLIHTYSTYSYGIA